MLDLILPDRNVCGPLIKHRQKNSASLLLSRKWYCKQLYVLCLLHCRCSTNVHQLQREHRDPSLYLCVGQMLKRCLSTLVLFLPLQQSIAINTSKTGPCQEGAMASSIAHALCIIVLKATPHPSPSQHRLLQPRPDAFTSELRLTLERYPHPFFKLEMADSSSGQRFPPHQTRNDSRSFGNWISRTDDNERRRKKHTQTTFHNSL